MPKDTVAGGKLELGLEPQALQSLDNQLCRVRREKAKAPDHLWSLGVDYLERPLSIFRERMRNSDTQDQLGEGLLLLHIQRS